MLLPSAGSFPCKASNPLLAQLEDTGYNISPKSFSAHSKAGPVRDENVNPSSSVVGNSRGCPKNYLL